MTAAMASHATGTDQVSGEALTFQSLFFVGALLFLITLSSTWSPTASCAGQAEVLMAAADPTPPPAITRPSRRAPARGPRSATSAGTLFQAAAARVARAVAAGPRSSLFVDVVSGGWPVFADRGPATSSRATLDSRAEARPACPGPSRGTFWIGIFVVVLAFPLGIGAAVYLEEYARRHALHPASSTSTSATWPACRRSSTASSGWRSS